MGRKRKGEEDASPKYGNRYTAGVVSRERVDRVLAFKPKIGIADALFADMEARGMNATQWLDMVAEKFFSDSVSGSDVGASGDSVQSGGRRVEVGELSPVVRDAIATSIEIKQAALKAERKSKRPNQALIEKWQGEIEELEGLLEE